jgi:nitroreductase
MSFLNFIDAMNFRHACRVFDSKKTVSPVNQQQILEFGRLSPSSFGMEPWHFLVINNADVRQQLLPACWNQTQITDSSFVVVFLARLPQEFRRDSEFMRERLWRVTQAEEGYQQLQNMVTDYLAEQNTGEWAKRQVYLALANMMTGAASLGIDSCPIEGFRPEALKELLKNDVDWKSFDPVAICAFGYRAGAQPQRHRESIEKISSFIVK